MRVGTSFHRLQRLLFFKQIASASNGSRALPLWALSRRCAPDRPTTASDRRTAARQATLLKMRKNLCFGNDCFRSTDQTRPAAPPQGGSGPKLPTRTGRMPTLRTSESFGQITGLCPLTFLAGSLMPSSIAVPTTRAERCALRA